VDAGCSCGTLVGPCVVGRHNAAHDKTHYANEHGKGALREAVPRRKPELFSTPTAPFCIYDSAYLGPQKRSIFHTTCAA
jgi:hypothetical protein